MRSKMGMFSIMILIVLLGVIMLASCSNDKDIDNENDTSKTHEPISNDDNKLPNNYKSKDSNDDINDKNNDIKFTGELITDGTYSKLLYFVPDKETREYIQNNLSYKVEESMLLEYNDESILEDLPNELGIYKVEIVPNINNSEDYINISSIKLTDKIGTIEYEGKEYPTNEIDENVKVKDRICGLIVSRVMFMGEEKEGILIRFCGSLEVEGYYALTKNGELYEYINTGTIYANTESLNNIPNYKGEPIFDDRFTVYFSETNDLYKELSDFSAVGYGKFKVSDYLLYGGAVGMELFPTEQITEIIELDENYKGMFNFESKDCFRYVGSTDKYILVYDADYSKSDSAMNYYLIDRKSYQKNIIYSSESNYYEYIKTSDERFDESEMFCLITQIGWDGDYYEKKAVFRYNTDGTIIKELNYADFVSYGTERTVYENQDYIGMKVEKISMLYYVNSNVDEFVKLIADFSGEVTLTGTINISNDEEFGYQVQFTCDEESSKKLPYAVVDTRSVWFTFINENIKELVGTEVVSKQCKITINNYSIAYAETETRNSAELVSIEWIE